MKTVFTLFIGLCLSFLFLLTTSCENKEANASNISSTLKSGDSSEQNPEDQATTLEITKTLKFGVYTSDKPTEMYKKFNPVVTELTKAVSTQLGTGVKIELEIIPSYQKALEAIANSEIDFMRVGPASVFLAQEINPKVGLLAMELKKGKKTFKGTIVVRRDSSIFTFSDLKGKSFAFGDKRSTIGRYLCQDLLLKNEINASDFSKFDYLGRHDKVAHAVLIGDFDAGAVKSGTLKKVDKQNNLRVLASFNNVTKPWISSPNLDEKVKNAISHALINIKSEEALKSMKVSGWTKAKLEDYQIIQQAMSRSKNFGG